MSDDRKADEAGGPAFPISYDEIDEDNALSTVTEFGLSIRDYFAAHSIRLVGYSEHDPKRIAERCYAIADAMLEARKAKT